MAAPQPCPPPSRDASPILSLEGVSVHYGRRLALGDVTLRFSAGESVAVVGPNGAGKSTLLRVLAGMLTPSHGRLTRHPGRDGGRPRISYVPQRTGVDWSFPVNVLDVVLMGLPSDGPLARLLPFRRAAREQALAALDRVGMRDYAHTQIGELSGGQQQRVFLARALVQEGDVLLLDEPFTGVDVPTQDVLLAVLAGQCQTGRTVIYATHDLGQARQAATRMLLVNGSVIADGDPRSVLTAEALRSTFGGQALIIGADELAPSVTGGAQ